MIRLDNFDIRRFLLLIIKSFCLMKHADRISSLTISNQVNSRYKGHKNTWKRLKFRIKL